MSIPIFQYFVFFIEENHKIYEFVAYFWTLSYMTEIYVKIYAISFF